MSLLYSRISYTNITKYSTTPKKMNVLRIAWPKLIPFPVPIEVRMKKTQKQKNSRLPPEVAPESQVQCPISKVDSGIIINIHAKPGSKCSQITNIDSEDIYVSINSPAQDGKANTELVLFMAQTLGLSKGKVSLVTGHRSRDKRILVESDLNPNQIMEILSKSAA